MVVVVVVSVAVVVVVVVQLLRRRPRCQLEVRSLMSRRLIQQLRETGTSRHDNGVTTDRDADDDLPTSDSALRMSLRNIRSIDDVTDHCRSLRSKQKVGIV